MRKTLFGGIKKHSDFTEVILNSGKTFKFDVFHDKTIHKKLIQELLKLIKKAERYVPSFGDTSEINNGVEEMVRVFHHLNSAYCKNQSKLEFTVLTYVKYFVELEEQILTTISINNFTKYVSDLEMIDEKDRWVRIPLLINELELLDLKLKSEGKKLSKPDKLYLNLLRSQSKLYSRLNSEKVADSSAQGFECNHSEETITKIFNVMTVSNPKQIITDLDNFKAIFGIKGYKIQSPVIWNIKRRKEPNKSSLFTFLALVLELEVVHRTLLRQANVLFKCGAKDIFADDYSYPSPQEQKSSKLKYFGPIKKIIENSRPA